jgi:hypothetical protein
MKIKKLILSRGRAVSITSHKLFPGATLLVPENEKREYGVSIKNDIDTIPKEVCGLGNVRNWVLDHYKEECIVMIDDDIIKLWVMTSLNGYAVFDPKIINTIIENTALMARELPTSIFGFDQAWDVRKTDPFTPFSLKGWVGGVIGIIGRSKRFIDSYFKVDIDFCLQTLLKDRILFIDNRYSFVQKRIHGKGGNAIFRSQEKFDKEIKRLQNKWGKYFLYERTPSGETSKILVDR